MTLKVLGYSYDVDFSNTCTQMGAMGRCDTNRLLIQIANDSSLKQQESTMLHEILEALDMHMELNLSHQTICLLEAALYEVLTDNGVKLASLLRGDICAS